MAGDDSAKEIQGLNRGIERVFLRERKGQLLTSGPSSRALGQLSAEDVREEICELSILFIEDAWPQLRTLLLRQDALLLRPDAQRGMLVPVTPADLAPIIRKSAALDESAPEQGEDALTQIAVWAELLLRAVGTFTERRQATKAFLGGEQARQAALYVRYCDLLDRLSPPETPTSHGIVNSLAGLQVTLALCEVIPAVYKEEHGQAMPRELFAQIVAAPELTRLILAIASTRSQASNAILAALMGPRFAVWRHSLLPRSDGSRPPRLRFLPQGFYLQPAAEGSDAGPPSLQIRREVLTAIREQAETLVAPGRTRQLMCPAFFADHQTTDGKVTVIQDFIAWLLEIVQRYYVSFF